MSFFLSTPLFLGGIAFIAVPIIFHIFPRLKPEILRFSTIKIFKDDTDLFSKSLRLKNIFRLLIRILFIIFLSLAFSHPSIETKKVSIKNIEYQNLISGFKISSGLIVKDLPITLKLMFTSKHNGFKIIVKDGKKIITDQRVPADYDFISMNIVFNRSGDHRLSIFAGENNKNIADIILNVKSNYNILMISSKKKMISDGFFNSFDDKYFIYRKSLSESISKISLDNSDIIILDDPLEININNYRLLEEFLKSGGNLWIFPTEEMPCEYINKMFHSYSESYNGFLSFDYKKVIKVSLSTLKIFNSSISEKIYRLPDRDYTLFSYDRLDDNAKKCVICGNNPIAFSKDFGKGKCISFLSPLDDSSPLFRDISKMPIYLTALIESTIYRQNSVKLEKKELNNVYNISKNGPKSDYYKIFIILCMIICLIELLLFLKFKKV